jgi:hypothetical protein
VTRLASDSKVELSLLSNCVRRVWTIVDLSWMPRNQFVADESESWCKFECHLMICVCFDNSTHSFHKSRGIFQLAAHLADPTMKWFCRRTCAMCRDSCSITTIISARFRIVSINNEIVVELQCSEVFEASLIANKTQETRKWVTALTIHYAFFLVSLKFPRLLRLWVEWRGVEQKVAQVPASDVGIPFKASQNRRLIK